MLLHTQPLSHTDAGPHRSFYTGKTSHRAAFTHRSIYIKEPLHTHNSFLTDQLLTRSLTLLHREAYSHKCFYTEQPLRKQKLLHRAACTQRPFTRRRFYREQLLYTKREAFMRGSLCTQEHVQRKPLHRSALHRVQARSDGLSLAAARQT